LPITARRFALVSALSGVVMMGFGAVEWRQALRAHDPVTVFALSVLGVFVTTLTIANGCIALRSGAVITDSDVIVTRLWRRVPAPRSAVRGVVADTHGQVRGFIDTVDGQVPMWSWWTRHRHGRSSSGCSVCRRDIATLQSMADALAVPLTII